MEYQEKVLSSNVNEVIRTVLNSFFNKKISHAQKAQKVQKAQKAQKSTKTQPSKSTKRYKPTKIKNALKKHLRGKSHLFDYLRFCAFCQCEEKKIVKRENSPQCKCTKYQCLHN